MHTISSVLNNSRLVKSHKIWYGQNVITRICDACVFSIKCPVYMFGLSIN